MSEALPPYAAAGLAVVILAAGRSSRMGRPKMLLPWGGTSVLGHLVDQWRQLGAAHLAVVLDPADPLLAAELDRLGFPVHDRIPNPAPARGMFSSIQCAAAWDGWSAGVRTWAIVLGDQPHLRLETLRRVVERMAAEPNRSWQPICQGRRGHPVLLPLPVFRQARDSVAATFKDFLGSLDQPVGLCDVEDPGLGLDIDRPDDYQQALKLAFG